MTLTPNRISGIAVVGILLFTTLSGLAASADSSQQKGVETAVPALHHILIEVKDINSSLRFYRDCLGLRLSSRSGDFVTLESTNAGIYLWQNHRAWEKDRPQGDRSGIGMYPHFDVPHIIAATNRFKASGYKIVQPPITYDWGKEAFVQDPDGYVIALVTMVKAN